MKLLALARLVAGIMKHVYTAVMYGFGLAFAVRLAVARRRR